MRLSDIYRILRVCIVAACALLVSPGARGAEPFDPLSAGIEDNINNPAVPQKLKTKVSSAMLSLERTLRDVGYKTTRVRSGEVVLVTIPCSALFAPNSDALKNNAGGKLAALVPYVKRSDNYKVIVAVHADNTGDEEYADRLTADRANAIDEYFFRHNANVDTGVIPYGLGADEPIAPNTGVRNRAANRRVEIYFVPTSSYIEKIRNR